MIAIVTDSTAYLTHDEAVELGVVVVPMSYSLGDGLGYNEGCLENDTSAQQQVAAHIDSVHTSQATLSGFISVFQMLQRAGYEILCLTISSRLSGTYANAMLAAKEVGNKHIQVIDSLTTCSGLYLLIREARRRIRNGEKLNTVARNISKLRDQVRICFSVDDMTPLRRSGRLGNVRMSVSTVLNIKTILEIRDGVVASIGIARGRTDQANKLCEYSKDATGTLIIDNFLGEEAAEKLLVRLAKDDRSLERRRIGPVLGAHLGRGCVGVAFIDDEG